MSTPRQQSMKKAYLKRLRKAFETDPKDYHLTDMEENTPETCACGADIHNVYYVQNHEGHVVKLGSTCIENYDGLNHVIEDLQKLENQRKEKKKLAKQAKKERDLKDAMNYARGLYRKMHPGARSMPHFMAGPEIARYKMHHWKMVAVARYCNEAKKYLNENLKDDYLRLQECERRYQWQKEIALRKQSHAGLPNGT